MLSVNVKQQAIENVSITQVKKEGKNITCFQ